MMSEKKNRVFINSLPKSGTHLLAKTLDILGYEEHFNESTINSSERIAPLFLNYKEVNDRLLKVIESSEKADELSIAVGTLTPVNVKLSIFQDWLASLTSGRYILGHIAWTSVLSDLLTTLNYRHLFIIRDPRAVIVSLFYFVKDAGAMPKRHFLEADFVRMTERQRLALILEGGDAPYSKVKVTPFRDIFRAMFAWSHQPNCLFIRFEDLIGEQGGGSQSRQQKAVEAIMQYLGHDANNATKIDVKKIYSSSARTFRKGRVDDWERSLSTESIQRIKAYCEPLCEEGGY